MTYQDTLNWMFSQLPMYQRQGKSAYKADLYNTIQLVSYLKHPEKTFKSIHVAGTNGKGSTSHILASMLQEAGYKVGLYTSPHLKDFRERIKINGKTINQDFVINFIAQHKPFFEVHSLSFFEMTVGMAFTYFSEENVDIAVIEVGLGGRLDSTNVIIPEVAVITNIGKDHTQFLGNTLEAIAAEKAGIIKSGVPVVIGETQEETVPVFKRIAEEKGCDITFADQELETVTYKSDLTGSYQSKNMITAVKAIQKLKEKDFNITAGHIEKGLLQVVKNTGLLGRWQILGTQPKVVCDTGHNKEGLTYIVNQLAQEEYKHLHIVYGAVNDKDLSTIVEILPKTATYYFCKPNSARGLDVEVLKSVCNAAGLKGDAYVSVKEAYKNALAYSDLDDLIFIGGSTFVVAEII